MKIKINDGKMENVNSKTHLHEHSYPKTFADVIGDIKTHPYGLKTTALDIQRSLNMSQLCEKVLFVDDSVIFVAAINKIGRMMASKLRDDSIIKNLTKEELEMLFMQYRLQSSMMTDFESKLSPFQYAVIKRQHIATFVVPFYDGTILLISQPYVVASSLARKIFKVLNEI